MVKTLQKIVIDRIVEELVPYRDKYNFCYSFDNWEHPDVYIFTDFEANIAWLPIEVIVSFANIVHGLESGRVCSRCRYTIVEIALEEGLKRKEYCAIDDIEWPYTYTKGMMRSYVKHMDELSDRAFTPRVARETIMFIRSRALYDLFDKSQKMKPYFLLLQRCLALNVDNADMYIR